LSKVVLAGPVVGRRPHRYRRNVPFLGAQRFPLARFDREELSRGGFQRDLVDKSGAGEGAVDSRVLGVEPEAR
jgi:hypothetical protein